MVWHKSGISGALTREQFAYIDEQIKSLGRLDGELLFNYGVDVVNSAAARTRIYFISDTSAGDCCYILHARDWKPDDKGCINCDFNVLVSNSKDSNNARMANMANETLEQIVKDSQQARPAPVNR